MIKVPRRVRWFFEDLLVIAAASASFLFPFAMMWLAWHQPSWSTGQYFLLGLFFVAFWSVGGLCVLIRQRLRAAERVLDQILQLDC